MRVALCISGKPRFLKLGNSYLYENIIKNNNVDVFVHSWYSNSEWETGWDFSIVQDNFLLGSIEQLYNPKKMLVENQKKDLAPHDYSYYREMPDAPANVQFSFFYSIKKANDLKSEYEKENNFVYDCVVRTRFDCALLDSINLFEYNMDFVYYPDVLRIDCFCDWLFFGSSQNMNILSNTFSNIDSFYHDGVSLCGERLLENQIHKNNINTTGIKKSTFLIRDDDFSIKSNGKYWSV